MLSFWKRLRADTPWVRKLLQLPDSEVREVTGSAMVAAWSGSPVEAAGQAREMLRSLPGFAQATALADRGLPDRLAVYDNHSRKGPEAVGFELADEPPLFYARYMMLLE
jgi:hypothetical protein